MKNIKLLLLGIIFFAIGLFSVMAEDDFPYRAKYPECPPISTIELKKRYDAKQVIIVDVRSEIEFDVIHIKDAYHIPLSNRNFVKSVINLLSKNKGKIFAFYCNGVTCLKSYEATKKLVIAGYKNVFVYDAGIPHWANTYPKETLLLGSPIDDPKSQLIPKSEFKKKCVDFNTFKKKSLQENVLVIDARDFVQGSAKLPGLEKARKIPFDILVPSFIKKKKEIDKTLLIFDQVGKQVRWLMYYLVDNGYKDFYFLDKGATGVLKKQEYKD